VPQSPSWAEQLPPGTVLGQRYRIEQLIGSGGYASVYRAIDLKLRRERAIKELTDTDPGVRGQFEVEAGLLIKSTHPNIPRGYQLLEDRGRLYLVMEFVRGRDLEDLLNESLVQRRRPLDEAQVLSWAIEVSGALEEMHERVPPVIHRDIKPANIKITPEGKPILIDFGLAKLQTGGPTRTAAQGVSPGFAPPEQYMAKGRTDARSDIYGLGATLYACLTGKDPSEAPARLLAQTGAGGQPFLPPREMVKNVTISEATDRAVVRALELSPSHRYQTAHAFREDLSLALRLLTSGAAVNQVSVKRPTNQASAKQPAIQVSEKRAALADPRTFQPAAAPIPLTNKQPAVIPATGKQKALSAGPARKYDPAANANTSKQEAVADGRTGKQQAVTDGPTGKRQVISGRSTQGGAVAGALALAPAPVSTGRARREEEAVKRRAQAAAQMLATPLDVPRPRSWLNLRGSELSSLGKGALALSAVETLWGIVLVTLGIIEFVTRDAPQDRPFPQLLLIWLGVVALTCIVGAQILTRPVYRRGRLSGLRRGLQGFALTVYSLTVNGIGVWGALVFSQSRPNPQLAIVAFALFAVNVLIAGILSLANTLG
jgi:eukaryotic-like serine/threonine-protein kinase